MTLRRKHATLDDLGLSEKGLRFVKELSGYKKNTKTAWFVWSFAGIFYFYQFILRASPNVMADQLMGDFRIHASSFGLLAACYYYVYSFLQIPMGIFLDRFGPKRILRFAVLLCSCGALVFSFAMDIWIAAVGRAMIGGGAAAAFLGAVRLGTLWFSPGKLAFVVGLTIALGKLGGMSANLPLAILMDFMSWRETIWILAMCGFALSILIWIFIKDGPRDAPSLHAEGDWETIWRSFKLLYKHKNIWVTAFYGSLMYVPLTVFADAWGISFLSHVQGMERTTASTGVMMIFVGSALGSPLIAIFSNVLQKRRTPMMLSASLSLIVNSLLIFVPGLPAAVIFILLFLVGLFMTGQTLIFVSGCEGMPHHMSGTVSGFINMVVMLGGVIFQPLVGWILDFFWDGTMLGGIPVYTPHSYRLALSILPISALFAVFVAPFLRETYPEEENRKNVSISGET